MQTEQLAKNNYYRFCKLEGSEYIATGFALFQILKIIKIFEVKTVLEIGLGIGSISDSVLKMEYEYGVMKANSEQEAITAFGKENTIIVRPTYMFGPGDHTDRFIHWPVRLAKGGEILVPGKTDDPVQYRCKRCG